MAEEKTHKFYTFRNYTDLGSRNVSFIFLYENVIVISAN